VFGPIYFQFILLHHGSRSRIYCPKFIPSATKNPARTSSVSRLWNRSGKIVEIMMAVFAGRARTGYASTPAAGVARNSAFNLSCKVSCV
jgi:hypothetical protein